MSSSSQDAGRDVGAEVGSVPSGTVTLLFTDVEDSTRLWDEHSDEMRRSMQRHDGIVRSVIAGHEGYMH
jgi:class 3 adenylate cyclase